MEMSTDEIREVVWGDHKDFKTVVGESVIDTGRWENFMEMVVQQVSTGKFYQIEWRRELQNTKNVTLTHVSTKYSQKK